MADTLKLTADAAGMSLSLTAEVMKGAIKATEEIGTGLTLSAKSVTKGVVMGIGDVGGDVMTAASRTVKGAVTGAAEVGGDVSVVARRAVEGAIEAGKEIGANVEELAGAAVSGAIEAAASIGTTAARSVKEILIGVVEGLREVAGAAFLPDPPEGHPRARQHRQRRRPGDETLIRQILKRAKRPKARSPFVTARPLILGKRKPHVKSRAPQKATSPCRDLRERNG